MSAELAHLLEALLRDSGSSDGLARAALLIGQLAAPGLDIAPYLQMLEQDRLNLRLRIPADASRTWVISQLNHYLFAERGFQGNAEDYHDPRNSYLHAVMERRLGIPITLAILYLELGWGLGLPLQGVSFPGHFLVKCPLPRGAVVLDPFHQGMSLSEPVLLERLREQGVSARAPADLHVWLQPSDRRGIVIRLLRNLKRLHVEAVRLDEAIRVLNLLIALRPGAGRELLERGLLFRRLECWGAAVADLEAARACSDLSPADSEQAREALVALRARPRLLH